MKLYHSERLCPSLARGWESQFKVDYVSSKFASTFIFHVCACVCMCIHECMQAHVAFPPCFLRQCWHYRRVLLCSGFHVGTGDLSPGPHCVHQALCDSTESSPHCTHCHVSELRRCIQVLVFFSQMGCPAPGGLGYDPNSSVCLLPWLGLASVQRGQCFT